MMLKTPKFAIIMMLAPAMCLTARPYSTLPPNETPGPGSFFTCLIDDVPISNQQRFTYDELKVKN